MKGVLKLVWDFHYDIIPKEDLSHFLGKVGFCGDTFLEPGLDLDEVGVVSLDFCLAIWVSSLDMTCSNCMFENLGPIVLSNK